MNTSMKSVSEFVLHCVVDSSQKDYTIAGLIFIYLTSLSSNLLVILVIMQNHQLKTPMFLLIATLAILDLLNSTNLIPRMLAALISDYLAVPYGPCLLQIHVEAHILIVGTLVISLMAIDRYVAVVYPLRYPSLITNQTILVCLLLTNAIAVVFIIPLTVLLTELPFCQGNVLSSCFCDYSTMVQKSCTEDPKYLSYLSSLTVVFVIGPLLLILSSYFRITLAALQISSTEERKKVFSTCLTHLLVVCTIYVPMILLYLLPGTGIILSTEAYNSLVMVGNTVPPMLNPIIYSFRNKEIKTSLNKIFMWRMAGKN
ncbi:olfactory receptor 1M1-like [Erpetoichthys calabaricus]|uniref:olfactory receptor 1M1-like n=1 Tax=Erpetoichthys calabaricus TaxID=27687 RepID=UPI0010A0B64C|nr:olfactory receptor 1M1-like [Erpetoichthys calabaricus]